MEVSDIVDSLKRYPVAWISGVISLALGAYLYFTFASVGVIEQQMLDLEKEVQILKNNARQGADIQEDYDRFSNMFQSIDAVLMDHTQIAKNNGFFYSFASSHPVEIFDVSQRPVLKENANPPAGDIWSKKFFSVIPFSMEVNGLLTDIADMFLRFDVSTQMIEVRKFELTTTAKPEEGYMLMSLEVNVLGKSLKQKEGEGS